MTHIVTLTLLVFSLSIATTRAAPCQFTAGQRYLTADIRDCVLAIPVRNESLKTQTLDGVERLLSLYAFRDIVKQPPASPLFVMPVDIEERIHTLRDTPLISDYELLQGIDQIFIDLKDPHTTFIKPPCYGYSMELPMVLSSRISTSSGLQEVYIAGLKSWAPTSMESLIDSTVVSIDGVDGMQAIRRWCEKDMFISKDYGTAFNIGLSRYTSRSGAVWAFPANMNTTWVIGTRQLRISWSSVFRQDTTVTEQQCNVVQSTGAQQEEARKRVPLWVQQKQQRRVNFDDQRVPDELLFGDDYVPAAANGISYQLVSGNGTSAVVLRITSFAPADESAFLGTLKEAIAAGQAKKIANVVLDLRGNGGGSIDLGNVVFRALVSELHADATYDMIHSPLADEFVQQASLQGAPGTIWSPQEYIDVSTATAYNSPVWYYGAEGEKYLRTRGGATSAYSKPMGLNTGPGKPPLTDYFFQEMLVVSDGLCGSTCAVFSSHLQRTATENKISTVTVGGIHDKVQMVWSFPGGLVYNQNALQQDATALGVSKQSPYFPRLLPFGSSMTFAMLEIYKWNEQSYDVPLEYQFIASNHHLDFWPIGEQTNTQLYDLVLPLFGQL